MEISVFTAELTIMPTPNFPGCKLDFCFWTACRAAHHHLLYSSVSVYWMVSVMSSSLFSVKQIFTSHSFLITFCPPGFVDLHSYLPETSVWNNILTESLMREGLEQEWMSFYIFYIFLPKLSQPKRAVQWGRQVFIHMELSSWLIKQRKTKLLSGGFRQQVNQTNLPQVSGNPKGALNSFKMLFWNLGVLTVPETLNRSPVSLVPSERAGGLTAESPFTDPTGIWGKELSQPQVFSNAVMS